MFLSRTEQMALVRSNFFEMANSRRAWGTLRLFSDTDYFVIGLNRKQLQPQYAVLIQVSFVTTNGNLSVEPPETVSMKYRSYYS